MNKREIAIVGGAVAPGALLLALLFGSSPKPADDAPAPVLVHQIPAWRQPAPTARVVNA
jgi:hypothetical protein